MRFPLEHRGSVPLPRRRAPGPIVIVCDPLFDDVVGAACGGPAEDAWIVANAPGSTLLDRFDAGARRVISIYRATP